MKTKMKFSALVVGILLAASIPAGAMSLFTSRNHVVVRPAGSITNTVVATNTVVVTPAQTNTTSVTNFSTGKIDISVAITPAVLKEVITATPTIINIPEIGYDEASLSGTAKLGAKGAGLAGSASGLPFGGMIEPLLLGLGGVACGVANWFGKRKALKLAGVTQGKMEQAVQVGGVLVQNLEPFKDALKALPSAAPLLAKIDALRGQVSGNPMAMMLIEGLAEQLDAYPDGKKLHDDLMQQIKTEQVHRGVKADVEQLVKTQTI